MNAGQPILILVLVERTDGLAKRVVELSQLAASTTLLLPLLPSILPRPFSMPLTKPASSSSSSPAPSHSSTRLFLGNLHPSVSDYDLVHLLQPFGPLSKLDVVFHRSGPLRGKPKGFAFAEFTKREDALRAKVELDGKQFKGQRTLAVNFANQVDEAAGGGAGKPTRRRYGGEDDKLRPTTLSLVKNARQVKGGPDAKIAAMEAKLQALREKKGGGGAGTGGEASSPSRSQAGSSSLKKAPASAGLPLKPPPSSSSPPR